MLWLIYLSVVNSEKDAKLYETKMRTIYIDAFLEDICTGHICIQWATKEKLHRERGSHARDTIYSLSWILNAYEHRGWIIIEKH